PKNITEIGDYAFVWCSKINSINIPASTKKIGNYAFAWCGSLTNITVSSENANFSAENGILFNKDKTTLALYPNGKKENLYVIPKSVKTIAQGAFFASYVKGIDFSNVESIQKDAFFGCESLSDIAFSNTLSEIGSTAFYGCTAITKLDLPKSVTSIGESAFKNCSNLSSISLPGGISQIGDGAFANCNSLIADVYPGSYSELYVGNNNVKFQVVADVFLNNAQIVFDQKPVIINNRTLVPIRKICEALDLTVDWDETSQTAIITKGSTSIKIQINSTTVYKDNKSVTIDVPAQLIGNRTLVPVRAVSELFNITVEWDSENSRVMLQK
ncbi:MAG: leucine-rich repeat protein, partial [Bacillota bacterium]|nr:leucine-rich repeat protein [Bacillota bacterium]